jgi:NAD(P)-dependent dehydrogenase (short-subunit alcohol dehydrogenase family)
MKTYLITGANRGIGLGLTKQLLEQGHPVYATTRNIEASRDLLMLKEKFKDLCRLLELDVEKPESIYAMSKGVGGIANQSIDVLINNAGVYVDDFQIDTGFKVDQIQKSFQVNTIGPMLVTQALLPLLRRAGRPIVATMTSKMGSIGDNSSGGHYAYRMSKAALNMWCRSFAVDHKDIISVVLHPGWVKTEMGGSAAPISIDESCKGLIKVIDSLTLQKSGKFFDFQGKPIEW